MYIWITQKSKNLSIRSYSAMITNFSNLKLITVVNLYYYIGTLTLIILNSILFYDDKCIKYSHAK